MRRRRMVTRSLWLIPWFLTACGVQSTLPPAPVPTSAPGTTFALPQSAAFTASSAERPGLSPDSTPPPPPPATEPPATVIPQAAEATVTPAPPLGGASPPPAHQSQFAATATPAFPEQRITAATVNQLRPLRTIGVGQAIAA